MATYRFICETHDEVVIRPSRELASPTNDAGDEATRELGEFLYNDVPSWLVCRLIDTAKKAVNTAHFYEILRNWGKNTNEN